MSELTDTELSLAVALACGWIQLARGPLEGLYEPSGGAKLLSDLRHVREFLFATSLDACFAHGGPVEYVKAKGGDCGVSPNAAWAQFPGYLSFTHNSSKDELPSRALCLAIRGAIGATK